MIEAHTRQSQLLLVEAEFDRMDCCQGLQTVQSALVVADWPSSVAGNLFVVHIQPGQLAAQAELAQ